MIEKGEVEMTAKADKAVNHEMVQEINRQVVRRIQEVITGLATK